MATQISGMKAWSNLYLYTIIWKLQLVLLTGIWGSAMSFWKYLGCKLIINFAAFSPDFFANKNERCIKKKNSDINWYLHVI